MRSRQTARRRSLSRIASVSSLSSLVIAAGLLGGHRSVAADEPEREGPDGLHTATVRLVGTPVMTDVPLVGSTVVVSAAGIMARVAAQGVEPESRVLPTSRWSLAAPQGSQASLSGSGAERSIALDAVGWYVVTFTACPSGCRFAVGTEFVQLSPQAVELVFEAKLTTIAPPEIAPELPESATLVASRGTYEDASGQCRGTWTNGSAITHAQWVTTTPFRGKSDYTFVEGAVGKSIPAPTDNPMNHDTNDFKFQLFPDSPFNGLLNEGSNKWSMEVEWELSQLPEAFRPTTAPSSNTAPSDRVSLYGHHIFDCAHGTKTEIHPPAFIAVHRPRAFQIPADQLLLVDEDDRPEERVGSNVWVGGIVSDVYAGTHGGEMTSNCSITGLHQPANRWCRQVPVKPGSCGAGKQDCGSVERFDWAPGECIEQAGIDRSYTFNIYLPRNPKKIAAALGRPDAPEASLYFATEDHPDLKNREGAPRPTIVPVRQKLGDEYVTYLRVTVDLTGYKGAKWAQRIYAGWIYPEPENFALERWQLHADAIHINDSSDPREGDWRVWANTNNTVNEWTRIVDCDDCIETGDVVVPASSQWGGTDSAGRIAGNLFVFPHQEMWFHGDASEDDTVRGQQMGTVLTMLAHAERSYSTLSSKGKYVFDYSLKRAAGAAPRPMLSAAALALHDRYLLDPPRASTTRLDMGTLALAPKFGDEDEEDQGEKAFGGIPATALRDALAEGMAKRPREIDEFMRTLRAKLNVKLGKRDKARLDHDLEPLKEAVPTELWNAHFGDMSPKSDVKPSPGVTDKIVKKRDHRRP